MPSSRDSDWTYQMSASSRRHVLLQLQATAASCCAGGKDDPWGWRRGAHKDGLDVCAQYRAPDLAKLTDETLKSAYDCAACGKPMHDHVDVTPLETVNKKEQPKFMQEQPKPKPQPPPQQPAAASYSATASYFDAPVEVQDPDLLNELNDPLAVNARPKPRPPPPPDNTRLQQPPPPPQPYVPILDEAAKNAAVRKEVERMIEEANRKDTGGGAEDDEEARLMQELALVRARKLAAAQVVH